MPVCGVEPIDIQFVVDISKSIREEGLYETKTFLTEFVNASVISPTQAQLGILLFNSKVTNKFFIEDSKTKEEIKGAIKTVSGYWLPVVPSLIFEYYGLLYLTGEHISKNNVGSLYLRRQRRSRSRNQAYFFSI